MKKKAAQPELKEVQSSPIDDGVVIHVMPGAFLGQDATMKRDASTPTTPATIPPPASTVVKKPGNTIEAPKSRLSLITLALIVFVISGLTLGGYFIAKYAAQKPVIVEETVIEEVVEEIVVVEEIIEVVEDPNAPPEPGDDTDSDGLTNVEEDLYGTDYRNPDTDGDTYLDGNEVFHRYDPLSGSSSTLLDMGVVEVMTGAISETQSFDLHYPASFTVREAADGGPIGYSILIEGTDAHFTMEIYNLDVGEAVEDWYADYQSDDDEAFEELKADMTKQGYLSWASSDKLMSIVQVNEQVFVFHYELKEEKLIEYMQTFHMMLNSLFVYDSPSS